MTPELAYFLKINVAIALFYAFYRLFFHKDTFFHWRRIALLCFFAISLLYEAELLTSDEHIDRFMGPAGLTGLWQVEKRGEAGKLSAEERKQLDIKYAKTFSFWLDIKIILKTVTAFIQKENV